jgi:hypothetical protein
MEFRFGHDESLIKATDIFPEKTKTSFLTP